MLTTLFALPAHLLVEEVLIENQVLTLVITSTLPEMPCPECHQPSGRLHSRYRRTLADLPCQGRAVRLLVQVRRFFCDAPACSRKTFAEAFPGVAPKHARRTSRQAESLCSIAYALGGRAGARLVRRLAMPTSRYTLLRLLRRAIASPLPTPQVLGVDDFGATRSCMCSCKDSRKEALTWGSAPSAEPSLNQVRLGQCSRAR